MSDVIFPVGEYKGIPYFMPPVGFDEELELKKLAERNAVSQEQLRKLPLERKIASTHISVSFIYAHPGDYLGLPMLNASVQDWRKVFARLKRLRIDTVIFQAALWQELGNCYYQSRHFTNFRQYKVLETMFEAAEGTGMHIYLGGYGSVSGWRENFSDEELQAELSNSKTCFEEIYQLGAFEGMYFPAETAFIDSRMPVREKWMNTLYRQFADAVKEKDSRLKVIVSPATCHDPKYNGMFFDFWTDVLNNVAFDVLLPQDGLGTCSSLLERVDAQWLAWRRVADAMHLRLWSNNEIFERRGFRPDNNLYPASPERVAAQLALTAPYVDAHCCWEAMYFASEEAGEEGRRLMKFMESGRLV